MSIVDSSVFGRLRKLATLLAVFVGFVGLAGAQVPPGVQPGASGVRTVAKPKLAISTSLGADATFFLGQTVEFEVRVTNAFGNPVDLRLLNPPPACTFRPMHGAPTPLAQTVYWVPVRGYSGQLSLVFEARDANKPWLRQRLEVPVSILGDSSQRGMVTADVTGDGVLDLVASAHGVDQGPVANTGALYFWEGQATPSGAPTATFLVSGAAQDDCLGYQLGSQALHLADVSGDGIRDVVAVTTSADIGGVTNTGAVYVWMGGEDLAAATTPDASLTIPGATSSDFLGGGAGTGCVFRDVTGDGIQDLLVSGRYTEVNGIEGAVYLFEGGPGLSGAIGPTATLTKTDGSLDGLPSGSQGLLTVDFDRDGILDVVASSQYGTETAIDSGGIYVWYGGPSLSGTVEPGLTLIVGNAHTEDRLTSVSGQPIHFADFDADGYLDVISGSFWANPDGGLVGDEGAIYMWKGGPDITGQRSHTVRLRVSDRKVGDQLTSVGLGQGLQIADVTGDGIVDIVAGASRADAGGKSDIGRIYVWAGGPGQTGSKNETATLEKPALSNGDELGETEDTATLMRGGIRIADIDGDGILDVVGCAGKGDVAGTVDAGALYYWSGGPGLTGDVTPDVTLKLASPVADDHVGKAGIELFDITGDGIRDVISGSPDVDWGGTVDVGGLFVWEGGTVTTNPSARLTVPGAVTGDRLGRTGSVHFVFGDVSGDGLPDVVAPAQNATVGGRPDAGAIYVWNGGSALTGDAAPDATLTVPGAGVSDLMGLASDQGVYLADVTDDGVLDVVAVAYLANAGGVTDSGAIYVFPGGALTGSVAPAFTLTVSQASPGDHLGSIGLASIGQGLQVADFNGDGALDILAGAYRANHNGVTDSGAIYFWAGPITASGDPTVTMAVPSAAAGDTLCN